MISKDISKEHYDRIMVRLEKVLSIGEYAEAGGGASGRAWDEFYEIGFTWNGYTLYINCRRAPFPLTPQRAEHFIQEWLFS